MQKQKEKSKIRHFQLFFAPRNKKTDPERSWLIVMLDIKISETIFSTI